ncbi:MAG: hypothetical protein IJ151_06615 [Bacteroidales bacterium]|nr:hypothetical protein [Bacteroidales bacterium]
MKTNRLFLIAALLGATLASCQKAEELLPEEKPEDKPAVEQTWKLTVQTVDTKAMEIDGTTLKNYWKKGEKVAVYLGGTKLGTLEVTSETKAATTTLHGEISKPNDLAVNSELMLLSPGRDDDKWTYAGQDGSEPSEAGTMATMFNYATSTLSVTALDEVNHTITASAPTKFANQQSIYRFGFKVGGTGEAISVKSFMLSSNQNKLVVNRTYSSDWASEYGILTMTAAGNPTGNLYCMAIRNENTTADETYTFSVVGSDDALYEGSKTIGSAHLGNGKFLSAKSISISKKTFAPDATAISNESAVL